MALPLVMTGPGGDFVTRYEVRGRSIVRQLGPAEPEKGDAEQQGGGLAGWLNGRQRRKQAQAKVEARREADRFELHASEGEATYSRPAVQVAAAQKADVHATQAVMGAVETWMMTQQQAMRVLSRMADQMVIPADVLAAMEVRTNEGLNVSASQLCGGDRALTRKTTVAAGDGAYAAERDDHDAAVLVAEIEDESDTQTVAHSYPHPRLARGARLFADLAGIGGRAGQKQGHGLRARRGAHQKGSAGARPQQGTLFDH